MVAHTQPGDVVGQPSSSVESRVPANEEKSTPKKRGFSRFVALLNCCAPSERARSSADADGPGPRPSKVAADGRTTTEKPVAAMKNKDNLNSNSNSHSNSNNHSNSLEAHAPDSSMTDSKEPLDEGARESEKTAVGSDVLGAGAGTGIGTGTESAPPDASSLGRAETEVKPNGNPMNPPPEPASQYGMPEPHLAPFPEAKSTLHHPAEKDESSSSQTLDVTVTVQAPTPVVSQMDQQPPPPPPSLLAGGQTAVAVSEVETDIEMVDAPPAPPPTETLPALPMPADSVISRADDLPPPPPPAASSVPEPAPPLLRPLADLAPVTATEQPEPPQRQWLLPPTQPRFKGKKCLVLDLDETLVHSSFKVRTWLSMRCSGNPPPSDLLTDDDMARSSTRRTSPSP